MKKSLSKSWIVFALIGMLVFTTSKESVAAESQPDCPYMTFTCPDGTIAYGVVCDSEDLTFLLKHFCNIEIKPILE